MASEPLSRGAPGRGYGPGEGRAVPQAAHGPCPTLRAMGWVEERLRHGLGRFLLAAALSAGAGVPAARAQSGAQEPAGALEAAVESTAPAARQAALEGEVRTADALLREARFEEALDLTDRIRASLGTLGDGSEARRLRVRTEVAAATAHVALEQEEAARGCFRRALAAEPALDLDPAATAPKVLRVFRSVRSEPRGSR